MGQLLTVENSLAIVESDFQWTWKERWLTIGGGVDYELVEGAPKGEWGCLDGTGARNCNSVSLVDVLIKHGPAIGLVRTDPVTVWPPMQYKPASNGYKKNCGYNSREWGPIRY